MLVLDSGGITRLAQRSLSSAALLRELRHRGHWPPLVPSVVLVECLQGHAARDVLVNRLLKTCDVLEEVDEALARRAAQLRRQARTGSAVDAIVVAVAEPGGTVLTSDADDLGALAAYADGVVILKI